MIATRSYLRTPDGSFVDVAMASPPARPEQIEGAIEVEINYAPFLGLRHWDLIDHLWSNLLIILERLAAPQACAELAVGAQSVQFSRAWNYVQIEMKDGEARALVTFDELVDVICRDGKLFFTELGELVSEKAGDCWLQCRLIDRLRAELIAR